MSSLTRMVIGRRRASLRHLIATFFCYLVLIGSKALAQCPMPETTPAGTNDSCFTRFDRGQQFADNTVMTTALQPDGKVIIGGDFTSFNGIERNRIARLNADGTLDETFRPGAGFNNSVKTIALQPDGKIIVGGSFTQFNSTSIRFFVRLNADGSLDNSFTRALGFDDVVHALALQPDGKVIVGGYFGAYEGTFRNNIARINADGTLDVSFNPGYGFGGIVECLTLLPDGKVMVGGEFQFYNGRPARYIVRLNHNGQHDLSFNTGASFDGYVYSIAVQSDGKVLVGGQFAAFNGINRNRIARLNVDGSLDIGFDPGTGFTNQVRSSGIQALGIQSNGKVVVGGWFSAFNGRPTYLATRLHRDGSLDTSFVLDRTGLNSIIHSLTFQPDGKLIVGGFFSSYHGYSRNFLARLDTSGLVDLEFIGESGFNGLVTDLVKQPDGSIMVVGEFREFNNRPRNRMARLNSDGSLDQSFNTGTRFNDRINTLAPQSGGKWIIGGSFSLINGRTLNRIARLNADGSLDSTFNIGSGFNLNVNTLVVQQDGKVWVGGNFRSFNGIQMNRIARLNSDGTLDQTFNSGTGFNNVVQSLALQPDGKVIVTGSFTTYNGSSRNRIARLNADGTLDASFNPGRGFNDATFYAVLQSDGKVVVCGFFSTYDRFNRSRIARLHTDGSLDVSFDPGAGFNDLVYGLALQPDGKMIAGGVFTSFVGTPRNYIARLNDDGTLDSSFDPGTGFNAPVFSLTTQPDGKVLVGGLFTSFNGRPESHITRLFAYSPTVTSLSSTNGTQARPHSTGKSSSTLLAIPNPARGSFQLRGLNQGASVTLHDVTGRRVLDTRPGSEGKIDVSSLPAGLYRWHAGNEQGSVVVE